MTSASSPELWKAALAYAKRGFPVFPLRPKGKEPLTKRGFHDAVIDRDTVLAFWSQYPTANIGIQTGVAFDVLDIDGEEGHQSFLTYLREAGAEGYHHAGPVSRTGRGFHLLFAPTGFRNGANLRSKIDFRGDGGYIVAPPSVHPLGHLYAWAEGRGPETPLPTAPPWLTQLLNRTTRSTEERDAARVAYLAIVNDHPAKGLPGVELTSKGRIVHGRPDITLVAAQQGLSVVHRGSYDWTTCPFHPDTNPSLTLYPDNTFHCFVCEAHGDSIDLQSQRDMNGRKYV